MQNKLFTEEFEISDGKLLHYNGSAADVAVPEGVVSVGPGAFSSNDAIESVFLPDSVQTVSISAFASCSSLRRVRLSPFTRSIEFAAFMSCVSLESIVLNESLEKIGPSAFFCTGLTDIRIPASVRSVGKSAFAYCPSLSGVSFASGDVSVDSGAFSCCPGLADKDGFVIVNGTLYNYYGMAPAVAVPDGVLRVSSGAFSQNDRLVSLILPESCTALEGSAVCCCASLARVSMPCVTGLSGNVLDGCPALKEVFAPKVPIMVFGLHGQELPAGYAFIKAHKRYTDRGVVIGYRHFAIARRRDLLAAAFREDSVDALNYYIDEDLITVKEFETVFFAPAQRAGALRGRD